MKIREYESDLVRKAIGIAEAAHEGQFRKFHCGPNAVVSQSPKYIEHPLRVAQKILDLNFDSIAIAAAVLHDVIEDCDRKWRGEIVNECGAAVFALVYELTNPSKDLQCPRIVRKEVDRYHLAGVSITAVNIKLADRTDNLLEMTNAPKDFLKVYVGESENLLATLLARADEPRDCLVFEYKMALTKAKELAYS